MGARCNGLPNRRKFRRERIVSSRTRGCGVGYANGETKARSLSSANVRKRMGMDSQRLLALSWLPRGQGRARGIQRQVYVQPIRLARWFVRNLSDSYSPDISQF